MKTNPEAHLEADWQKEIKLITTKAAETSWPLTAFCCFFFIFVEIENASSTEYFRRFCFIDFGAGLVVLFAHLLRKKINYPDAVLTYGSSTLVAIVSTIAAVFTT